MKSKGIILVAIVMYSCDIRVQQRDQYGCRRTAKQAVHKSRHESNLLERHLRRMRMTIVLKDNETGNLLENKVVEDEEKITAFNQMCGGLKNPTDEKYSEAFFDSITSSEYTLNFSSSDFAETASEKGDAVIVECNGLSYELAVGGEEWQKIADFLDSISK